MLRQPSHPTIEGTHSHPITASVLLSVFLPVPAVLLQIIHEYAGASNHDTSYMFEGPRFECPLCPHAHQRPSRQLHAEVYHEKGSKLSIPVVQELITEDGFLPALVCSSPPLAASASLPVACGYGGKGEIVHLQVGACGNRISSSFWKSLVKEHKMDIHSKTCTDPGAHVYFHEHSNNTFSPRVLLIDLEPGSLDYFQAEFPNFLSPDDVICGSAGAGNSFGKGMYEGGSEIIEQVMDGVRQRAEMADRLQGFQMAHAVGSGTGSGFGSLLQTRLREEYPKHMQMNFTVFPSPAVSDTVVEPYNAILALHYMLENSDMVFALDNESLFRRLSANTPLSYSNLNQPITAAMSHVTSLFRSNTGFDMRRLATNLVPFPRFRLLSINLADDFNNIFDHRSALHECEVAPYLTGMLVVSGMPLWNTLEHSIQFQLQGRKSVFWIPDGIKVVSSPLLCTPQPQGCLVSNCLGIFGMVNRLKVQFSTMFRRKAFLWGLTAMNSGMDEMEFAEAESDAADLLSELQQYMDIPASDIYGSVS